jgi:uncharacterized protein
MDTLVLLGIAFLAAVVAGLINAVAGGGTLVSFPVLMALGLSPVSANVTNTIGLCPGYFGGIFAQRKDLPGQKKRLMILLPLSIAGGIAGGVLLIQTGDTTFRTLVPWLILAASLLLAVQAPVKRWLQSRAGKTGPGTAAGISELVLVFLAAVYGGYFGAGVSVIVIAVLGLIYDDSFTRLNVLKQAISSSINISAAVYFIFSGMAVWMVVLVMAAGSIAGGFAGGSFTGLIKPDTLRYVVVCVGITVSCIYFMMG